MNYLVHKELVGSFIGPITDSNDSKGKRFKWPDRIGIVINQRSNSLD